MTGAAGCDGVAGALELVPATTGLFMFSLRSLSEFDTLGGSGSSIVYIIALFGGEREAEELSASPTRPRPTETPGMLAGGV